MASTKKEKPLPKGITRRSDGRYMGRFSYYGERYTLYDTDLRRLNQRMKDMRYELEHGLYAKESEIRLDDWFHTWIAEYKKPSVKTGTIGVYENTYESYIKKPLGKIKLKDIRPEQIQSLYNKLNAQGYSRNTIELTSVVLSGMYKQAYKNRLIQVNPVPLTTLPKMMKREERRVLTQEEQKLFLNASKAHQYGYVYELALSTGMRSGELRALRWSDIDFDKKIIHVRGTLVQSKEGFYIDSPKTASSFRDIPMLDNVYCILKEHRKEQAKQKLLLGPDWKAPMGLENLVVTTSMGAPLGKAYLNNGLKVIIKGIQATTPDFEYITIHGLRHCFATRCIEQGMTPQTLKSILGHSKLSMTMDLYSHVLPDMKQKEIQKIANLF